MIAIKHFKGLHLILACTLVCFPLITAPVDCPNGGSYDATWNRCYVVETTVTVGWAEARDVCSDSYGGTLAIVSSREEQATLEALLADQ